MARGVSELKQGQSFSRSFREGQVADRATRKFRILLEQPGEVPPIQPLCGVFIGDPHPDSPGLFCLSFSAQYEGDSRMVVEATFEYEPFPSSEGGGGGGQAPQPTQPDIQPANWSISSSLVEMPVRLWKPRTDAFTWGQDSTVANRLGEIYDDVTTMRAMVTISITQFGLFDPTANAMYVGSINSEEITLGSLKMKPHTVMLRGLNVQNQVKPWGNGVFRGWEATYEFGYMENIQSVNFPGQSGDMKTAVPLGWDIAMPASGWNCIAFNPAAAADNQDVFAIPLKTKQDEPGVVKDDPFALAEGAAVGDKVRGLVKIHAIVGEKAVARQGQSASPIALNEDGTPRKITSTRDPLVYAYQVHNDINFTTTLGLRIY
jgi:hypothetical protein